MFGSIRRVLPLAIERVVLAGEVGAKGEALDQWCVTLKAEMAEEGRLREALLARRAAS